jgi:predicted ATPase
MILDVENFGPIKKGKINFKPFTVFIGKNDSGKSYMGMLTYALHLGKSECKIKLTSDLLAKYIKIIKKKDYTYTDIQDLMPLFNYTLDVSLKDLLLSKMWGNIIDTDKMYKTLSKEKLKTLRIELEPEEVKSAMVDILKVLYGYDFLNTIEYCFSNDVQKLIKSGKRTSKLKISTERCSIEIVLAKTKKNCKVIVNNLKIPKVNITIEPTKREMLFPPVEIKEDRVSLSLASPAGLYIILTNLILSYLGLPSLTDPCYYLPASRSGMILGLEAFISGVIERLPLGASKIPGVVSDFLNEIKGIAPETKGFLYELGLKLEGEIGWNIDVKKKEKLFKIIYKKGRKKYEKENVSSGVLELSPFILYLKHVMLPFGTLIVEEPEAHIHPSLQRIFIKYLVKLVRRSSMRIVVITHSDYVLEQINRLIALGNLNKEKRQQFVKKMGYDSDDYLLPDEVSAYLFKIEKDGCTIEKLEIDEDGILENEFFKVSEELYEEHLLIKKLKEGYV